MSFGWRQLALGLGAAALGASAMVLAQSSPDGAAPAAPDRAGIEAVVRDYILAHPEIISQAMDRLQANQTGQLIAANRKAIETPFPGAEAGNPGGDVTLVEYLDYACGYCRASVADVDRLIAGDPKLHVVFRELPILGAASATAANASLAAAAQGRFYAFHRALYAAGQLTDAKVAAVARATGVRQEGTPPGAAAEIAANLEMARTLRVSGTPSFVVGDQMLSGAVGHDALAKAIAETRAARKG